jgi:molybdenum cofactor cytidylyltransferase
MQTFAIIPAAGRSQRMGQPKLLLPWGPATLIEHVLATWRASRASQVIVVVHPQDQRISELAAAAGAHVVRPETPPEEMKVSVRLALEFAARFQPRPSDAWLLAPADMPGLTAQTIDHLIDAYQASLRGPDPTACIWAASYRGRRGHPVLFPWSLAAEVARLAAGEGLNALLARHPVADVESADDAISEDLDTPEDYERLRSRYGM